MAKIAEAKYIWMSGKLVPWNEAKVHVLTHALHYGSGVFEGIRAYKTRKGTAVFRLKEHIKRLLDSAKIYRMESPYTSEELINATIELIKANELEECYIRPLIYRGYYNLGVNPLECPVEVSIAAWKWGKYLGPEALEEGVDAMISTWNRMAPNTFPAMAKATANYANSQLIKMEALNYGVTEGIALNTYGTISEGSGENIFIVKDGILYTPSIESAVLPGITRLTVIEIARKMGIEVKECLIPREMLYLADEVFFTGTAAEISPIRSVDKIPVGNGKIGPITKKIQQEFFKIIEEADEKYAHYFTWVK
ncbi:MAG TPA: branched-chain amino acid transaminase [Candidatus Hydrothermia bacterium]|nr:branched-chain amino acid transaminase [Candidatus Hydrothermae bacterium]MDD3648905.1 branched-chain amino acid transaminase [Candidatus Hydrothermia bacterium]MDD5572611.1 branched-chain amino acid transaminase [Candidatus Hydrothermia bacterium]HOK23146.1 branched-chain amino acid transaminase [Candidatus Hydrothermia bacterium]HOL23850.1 branched-chain amino acid transaminase [Candidatus Hydrothermia bacterium]